MTPSRGLVDISAALERKGNPKNCHCCADAIPFVQTTSSLGLVEISAALERKGNPKNSACTPHQGFVLAISQLRPSKRLLAASLVEDLLSGCEKGFPSIPQ
mmetsp:Transcript_30088/g.72219  ORF Transcript_30088/g.72219 Transcript_30088/m.72219 type:complete len:101 (+) Transcript_30088:2328-2630(+)